MKSLCLDPRHNFNFWSPGYDIHFSNVDIHPITAFINTNLGTVNGYDKKTTEYLIASFGMKGEIAASLRSKIRYHNQKIGGALGLRDANVLINNSSAEDLDLIHPPYLPNIKFGKVAMTNELVCFGSFGVDVDNFKVNDPTFLDYYYGKSGQILPLNMTLQFINDGKVCNESAEISKAGWQHRVSEPILEYLMNLEEPYTYAEVPDEKIIQISGPESIN